MVGGFQAQGGGGSRTQNIPTVGRLPGGAIVERDLPNDYTRGGQVALLLRDPDFKREWDALEPEFQRIEAQLRHRKTQIASQSIAVFP